MEECISSNDLGNRKFLFNFFNEEDLQEVLKQSLFHYKFCIFVLVRWEPINSFLGGDHRYLSSSLDSEELEKYWKKNWSHRHDGAICWSHIHRCRYKKVSCVFQESTITRRRRNGYQDPLREVIQTLHLLWLVVTWRVLLLQENSWGSRTIRKGWGLRSCSSPSS